jgi:hypothetical protein
MNSSLRYQLEFNKPFDQHCFGNCSLNNISSIKRVNTVCSNNTNLFSNLFKSFLLIIFIVLQMKISKTFKFAFYLINQLRNILKFHSFALLMEIPPNNLPIILHSTIQFLKIFTKVFLKSFLIN